MPSYLKKVIEAPVPQSEPLPGQVANSAGGNAWAVDDWKRLERFLILGSEGGSYYATERKLTLDNARAVERCIKEDGLRVAAIARTISENGRAPKNDQALFVLAMCLVYGDDAAKAYIRGSLPHVARTGTHLFQFGSYIQALGGWGRAKRGAVAEWYTSLPIQKLAYQAIKYRARDGWTHADMLRLSHPKTSETERNVIFDWMCNGWPDIGPDSPGGATELIWAYEKATRAATPAESAALITTYNLPREAINTEHLNDVGVWRALLAAMPMTAMIRNLGKMSAVGLLTPNSEAAKLVAERLRDVDRVLKSRIHPISILGALNTYNQGHGVLGKLSWTTVQPVVDALNDAFYLSFGNVPVTNKRWYLGCDVSSSMTYSTVAGMVGITPRIASAALALVTAAVEPQYIIRGFTSGSGHASRTNTVMHEIPISARTRLDDVIKTMERLPFGATDCALPMLDALHNKIPTDVFVIYTDSETWHGDIHPTKALEDYRQKMGIPAKLIVVGMVANEFTIADPNDAGMMDVVGFDTAVPAIMADFATDGQVDKGTNED